MTFDKTGTITKDEFAVTNFQSLSDDIDFNTLIYWVTCIKSKSSHPFVEAIVGKFAQWAVASLSTKRDPHSSTNGIRVNVFLFIGGVNMHEKLFIRMRTQGRVLHG